MDFWRHLNECLILSTGVITEKGIDICSPIVISTVEMELMDQVAGGPNIFTMFDGYHKQDPMRQSEFRQFLAIQNPSVETNAMKAGDEVLNAISWKYFGQRIRSRFELISPEAGGYDVNQ